MDHLSEIDWRMLLQRSGTGAELAGAMRHLDRFLGRLADAGARFRQDFPEACVPMRRGRQTGALDAITARPAAQGDVPPDA